MSEIESLKRILQRERASRKELERIMEEKSKELFKLNQELHSLNDSLENRIAERTERLSRYSQELEKAHEELKKLSIVASKTDNSVIITDKEGRINWVNEAFTAITGYRLDEVQGKKPGHFLQGPDTDPATVQIMKEGLESKQSFTVEILNYHKKAHPYWVSVVITPILDESGEVEKFIAIQSDITEKKEIELALLEREERFRVIFENSNIGIVINDVNGHFIQTNEAFNNMLGYSVKELSQMTIGEVTFAEDGPKSFSALSTLIDGKVDHFTMEKRYCCKNGEIVWGRTNVAKVLDENGSINYVIATIEDVTEAIKTKTALESTTQRLSTLIGNLQDGILVEDSSRHIALINQRFCDLFGIPASPEHMIGADCSQSAEQVKDMFADPLSFIQRIEELLEKRKVAVADEMELSDGRFFERDFIPVWSKDQYLGHMWQYRDITERKLAEGTLKQAMQDADAGRHAQKNFLAAMSHEIRTPMNAVIGMTNLLYDTHPSNEQKEYLDNLKVSSDLLLELISNILDFSKIEAGEVSFEEKPFNLKELLDSLVKTFEFRAKEKDIQIKASLDPRLSYNIIGDKVSLNQILNNLLGNALKFTEKGEISISIKSLRQDDFKHILSFEISDTGIGIEADHIPEIFKDFKQLSAGKQNHTGGTGLGLPITKRLIELQGGEISVRSAKRAGTTFSFFLPYRLAEKSLKEEKVPGSSLSSPSFPGFKALVVEDNVMNLKYIGKLLEKWEVEYHTASNGKEALNILEKNSFDMIFMDIQMPVMDGFHCTQEIRSMKNNPNQSIPIIALTASALKDDHLKAKKMGMKDHITKPFSPDQILSCLLKYQQAGSKDSKEDIKLADLSEFYGDDEELQREMFSTFLDNTPEAFEQIEDALAKDDFNRAAAIMHKIKPTFSMVGICGLEKDLEKAINLARKEAGKKEIQRVLSGVFHQFQISLPMLREELARLKSGVSQG